MPDVRRIICFDSGMMTYKNASQKTVEKGMKSLDGFKNTLFIGGVGRRAGDWARELRKLRNDPAWAAMMTMDTEAGYLRYDACVELQVYDGCTRQGSRDFI